MTAKMVSAQRLREVLNYDPDTGALTWRVAMSSRSPAGSPAGSLSGKGYRRLRIDGVGMAANRVAWAMYYGEWPDSSMEVDHIDGVRSNDRIENLRLATPSQNRANTVAKGKYPKGVAKMYKSKTFMAYITVEGVSKYLGSFKTIDEAAHTYNKAAIALYGDFARINPVGGP